MTNSNAPDSRRRKERVRAANEELAVAQARLAALLDAIGDAAWIRDSDGTYVAANRAFAKLVGREPAQIIGLADRDLLGDTQAGDQREKAPTTNEREEDTPLLQEVMDGEGQKRLMAIVRRTVRDPNGNRLGSVGVARDMTEQRELEQRLIQSQKMDAIGRLAGGVAHDFNNMLTAIQGYGALLLMELPEGDSRRENVEEILKAGERAAALTRQLLAFSRRQVLEPRVLDLNAVVGNVTRMISRLIGENIQLSILPAPDLWHVLADPVQIEQVIVNLAINARDAMSDGGKLTIETRNTRLDIGHWRKDFPVQEGNYALLTVSDTGVGMSPEVKSRLFEPFFTTKPRGAGTGLGLSTAYGIVKQSGGYIWVYSEPGKGSSFKVYLPRVDAALTPTEPARAAAASCGSETILFVEDEREVRSLVEKLLRIQGYRVLSAAEPAEAIAHARAYEGTIDLLVTDVMLPGRSGRDLAREIEAIRPKTPVLFVSGHSDEAVLGHGIVDPGTHFLQKPFTPSQLGKKIREILDSPR